MSVSENQIPSTKYQITNNEQIIETQRTETEKPKQYDLEIRTLVFSNKIISTCKKLPKNTINYELIGQIVRSACSIGANYREANEALSKKDFIHRIKICRKEAKETSYWLSIVETANSEYHGEIKELAQETIELRKILSSILTKSM